MTRDGDDLARALADFTAGRHDAAESACALILAERPNECDALNLMAVLLCRRGEFDAAMPLLVRVLENQPDNLTALTTMGDALFVLEEFNGAAECFRRAVTVHPEQGSLWVKQAQALHRAGRCAEAVPAYLEGCARGEDRGSVLAELGEALNALGRPIDAAAAFQIAARRAPDQAESWNQIGGVLASLGPTLATKRTINDSAPLNGEGEEIRFITGSNGTMFVQLFPLLQAFDSFGRRDQLVVADFGLTSQQRSFLAERGQLRQSLWSDQEVHPWWSKAGLIDYLLPEETGLIWVDADMFPLCDPQPWITRLLAEMTEAGQYLAAAHDPQAKISDLLTFSARSGKDCLTFHHLLIQYGIDLSHLYLNSGFFVARTRTVLEQWKQIAHANATGLLWEQNAFNVVARHHPERFLLLDPSRWNVHGDLLARAAPCDEAKGEIFLHATAATPGPFEERILRWQAEGESHEGRLRLLTRPDQAAHQRALLDAFFAANGWQMIDL